MSIIETKIEEMDNIVSGDDLVGTWNAFIMEDEEMKKLAKRIGEDFFDKFFHIRDNTVDQIGEICGEDYKKFVADILDDYETRGYLYWCAADDWLIYEGAGRWHTEELACSMISYILGGETFEEFQDPEITAEEIADRFLAYLKREFNIKEFARSAK